MNAAEQGAPQWSIDDDPAVVSCGERSLWCLDQLHRTSPAYNVCAAIDLRAELTLGTIAAALDRIAARHEAFRTYFEYDGANLRRRLAASRMRTARVDLSGLTPAAQEDRLRERQREDAATVFRLDRAPLARVTVVRRSAAHHCVIVTLHHIVCDGWSLRVLLNELFLHCVAAVGGKLVHVDSPPLQARHYAGWRTRFLQSPAVVSGLDYWRGAFAGAPFEPLSLSTGRFAPAQSAQHQCVLPEVLHRTVGILAQTCAVTPFEVLLAAIAIGCWVHSGRRELVLGLDFANRHQLRSYEIVGLLVNQLPVVFSVDPGSSYADLLDDVHRRLAAASSHSAIPFEKVLEIIQPARSGESLGVLKTKVVDRGRLTSPLTTGDCAMVPEVVPQPGVKYELAIFVERGADTRIVYEYDAGTIPAAVIESHAACVSGILRRLSLASHLSVRELARGEAA